MAAPPKPVAKADIVEIVTVAATVEIVTIAATVEVDGVFYGPGSYRLSGLSAEIAAALQQRAAAPAKA